MDGRLDRKGVRDKALLGIGFIGEGHSVEAEDLHLYAFHTLCSIAGSRSTELRADHVGTFACSLCPR